jgi:aspartyl-tRNA synthetase
MGPDPDRADRRPHGENSSTRPPDRRDRARIEEIAVQSRAEELPLPVFGDLDYPEETRLRYRF